MKALKYIAMVFILASISCKASFPNTVWGSGNIALKTFAVNDFDQLELGAVGEVRIEQGTASRLIIEAEENILPLLDAKVEDSTLRLGVKNEANIKPNTRIIYHVVMKSIVALTTHTSGDIHADRIETSALNIFVTGSGSVSLKDVKARDLLITSKGSGTVRVDWMDAVSVSTALLASGNVHLAGAAISHMVASSGSGTVWAEGLETSDTVIDHRGSGDVVVWASATLVVSRSGSGHVKYYGAPRISQKPTGSEFLLSLGDKSE